MTVDKAEVQAMINASVAPLHKQVQIVRRRTARLEKRVTVVEKDVATALTGFELTQRVFSEGIGRLELKLDKQQAEILSRLDKAEGFIGRRRRLEKTVLRVSQLAVVGAVRRVIPFLGLYGLMIVMWLIFVNLMGV